MPDSLENRALHQKTDPNQSNNCGIKKKKKTHEMPTTCGCTLEMAEDAPKMILGQNFLGLKNNPQSYG